MTQELKDREKFLTELTDLINRHSLDTEAHIPDFIIAEHLLSCYTVLHCTVHVRDIWFGRDGDRRLSTDLD